MDNDGHTWCKSIPLAHVCVGTKMIVRQKQKEQELTTQATNSSYGQTTEWKKEKNDH